MATKKNTAPRPAPKPNARHVPTGSGLLNGARDAIASRRQSIDDQIEGRAPAKKKKP